MRFRASQLLGIALFLGALLLLRQGILWMDQHIAARPQQVLLIQAHDLDPAALFYTESAQALAAEKIVRKRLAVKAATTAEPEQR